MSAAVLFFGTIIVAACSITYELLIACMLSRLAANAVIWYSVVIGLFLLGMGLGSLGFQKYLRQYEPLRTFITVEVLIASLGVFVAPLILLSHSVFSFLHYQQISSIPVAIFFIPSFLLTVLIGVLTGIELPLLMRIGRVVVGLEHSSQKILGYDYIGSLLGALCFALLLVPYFSMITVGVLVASVNMLVIVLFLCSSRTPWSNKRGQSILVAIVGIILVLFSSFDATIEQFFLKRFYCYRLLSSSLESYLTLGTQFPNIQRMRSPYQTIDMVHDMEGDGTDSFVTAFSSKFSEDPTFPHNRILFLNRDWQFHSNHEEVYHEYFAHVPIMQTGRVPRKVLVLGGGDGLLLRELVQYEDIEEIVHVDLDSVLVSFAKNDPVMRYMNKDALSSAKVTTVFGDAFQFVRETTSLFDAIYIDLPTPNDYNVAKLYSNEFYAYVRARLAPSGFMVFDAVGISAFSVPDENGKEYMLEINPWKRYYHSLKAAGFTRIVPYVSFLGWDQPQAVAMARNTLNDKEAQQQVKNYVRIRRNGFIMAGMPGTLFGHPYKPHDKGRFHVLNRERYKQAFHYVFPMEHSIDYSKVNSIFKPTFPVVPLWTAKVPF